MKKSREELEKAVVQKALQERVEKAEEDYQFACKMGDTITDEVCGGKLRHEALEAQQLEISKMLQRKAEALRAWDEFMRGSITPNHLRLFGFPITELPDEVLQAYIDDDWDAMCALLERWRLEQHISNNPPGEAA